MRLNETDRTRLLNAARTAAAHAYCPHSEFRVGAAVLVDEKVIDGCNVENASFGLTQCAERVAIFKAVSEGRRGIRALAVVCPDAPDAPDPSFRMPCGACLQVLAEFADDDCAVVVGEVGVFLLKELLPHRFRFDKPKV